MIESLSENDESCGCEDEGSETVRFVSKETLTAMLALSLISKFFNLELIGGKAQSMNGLNCFRAIFGGGVRGIEMVDDMVA